MTKKEYSYPRQENLHEPSELVDSLLIKKLEDALQVAWCQETLLPEERADWDEDDPAYSQCFVTALVVQRLLGGEIAQGRSKQDPDNVHAWNILSDGSQHDFDRSQFPAGYEFEIEKTRTPKSLLNSPNADTAETNKRYKLLLRRVLDYFRFAQ